MIKKGVIIVSLIFAVGCGVWSKVTYVWQGKFLKVDTTISKNRWELSKENELLANLFYDIDKEIEQIIVSLNTLSKENFIHTTSRLMANKPWIIGCYLFMEDNGYVTESHIVGNDFPIKSENIKDFFKTHNMNLTYVVFPDHKVMLIKKGRKDETRSLYVALLMDFKQLILAKGNLFRKFAVASLNDVIFANGIEADELKQIDLSHAIKDNIKGYITLQKETFFWAVRYIGNKPLFYLIKL